jgi:hypothetical protein
MTLRLIVADGPEVAVPPEPWVRLSDLVREAAPLVTSERVTIGDPGEFYSSDEVDLVLYERGRPEISPRWSVPTVQVTIGMHERVSAEPAPIRQHDSLAVSALDRAGAVATIAAWLRAHVEVGVSTEERRKLEAVVREVIRQIERGAYADQAREDVAQAQAAADTVNAQLRAPRPSRRILAWALGQLPTFVMGNMTGITGNYLYDLLRSLG